MKRLALALALILAAAPLAAISPAELTAITAKAQAGNADAQFALGEVYRSGRGSLGDLPSAITWYRRAAAQGHVRASEELGFALFAQGERKEAMPYIEKAAARGDARAMYVLGTAHFNGDYATRDWPLAYALTVRAASAGLSAATKNLDLMGQYLVPTDRAKAEQILATLPPVRTVAQREAMDAASRSAAGLRSPTPSTPVPAKTAAKPAAKPTKATADATSSSAPTPAVATAPARGSWKVQLGAYGSPDRAKDRWKTLAAKVPQLAAYEQHVIAFQSVQRLQAWGIGGRSDAESLCRKITAAGGQCLALAP